MKKITLLLSMLTLFAFTSWGQIIISQYYEGSSNNKWIEITNVGASAVDLTSPQLYLALFANAAADDPANNTPTNNYVLSGTIAAGQVLLFKNSSAVLPSYAVGTNSTICNFNGDDLVIISSSNSSNAWADRSDVIGNGTSWGGNTSFYRNTSITSTNTTYTPSEWTEVTIASVDNATSNLSEYLGTHIYSSGGNQPPVISNILNTPLVPLSTETVGVTADVTDDNTVSTVNCNWGLIDGGPYANTIGMSLDVAPTYETDSDIPMQADGATVYYVIEATDDEAETTTSPQQNYTVTDPVAEPTNHVATFAAGTPTVSTIPLTWLDNDGATPAGGFIIKASTNSTFADPVDGTPEADDTDMSDGSGQFNVASGIEAYTFAGLDPNTQYFFKIWPYTNTGANIDYKTDGTVPTDDESTTGPPTVTLPYNETFNSDLGDCYTYSVAGPDKVWHWADDYGNEDGMAEMSGYGGSDPEEDWLILPGINLDSYSDEIMQFYTYSKYGTSDADNYLKLFYSTDYSGTGDPTEAGVTWTELTFDFFDESNENWAVSGIVDLSGISGTSVYLAFKYHSTLLTQYTPVRWWVDNISIFEGSLVDVTFQVNMANETIDANGVHVTGSFNSWSPDSNELLDGDSDGIYTGTISLYSGIEYQFKYINGDAFVGEETVPSECQAPGTSNRFEVIGDANYTLDAVCFGSCTDCGDNYDITFQVDMQNEIVSGDGVYLAGTFTDWNNSDLEILMTNSAGSIWETTVSLMEGSTEEYKFINGDPDNGGSWESIDNRLLVVPSATTTLDLVCFNLLSACPSALLISEVTDPDDVYQARFVELYNASGASIDFDVADWYLCRQTNGGGTWEDKKLTGSVVSGGKYVAANYNEDDTDFFYTSYGFLADFDYGGTGGNGDDGYYLYYGGDHTSGQLIDAYGVINQNGDGTAWDYEDTKAVRLNWVSEPNSTWTSWEWSILPKDQYTTDMTPGEHKESVTWVGTTDTEWRTKGNNWSGTYGYIPDASFNVTIPDVTDQPVISTEAACNNLTIAASATLDVGVTTFDIFGDFVNNGGTFTIGSSTTQNGSVIVHATATGVATVERYLQGYDDGADNGWHNISSPVNSMVVAGSEFDPTKYGEDDDLYWWEETTSTWKNYRANAFDFTNGQGYLFASQSDGTRNFVGTLNTETVEVDGLTKGDGGFHLLGNPFASAIMWDNGNWNLTNIGAVAQIWEETNNRYTQISQGEIIPPTNGFFVEVSSAPGSLDIHKWSRTHSITDNYKSTLVTNLEETLDLRVTNDENSFYDICRVGFKDDATEAWDIEYDAHKLFGGSGTSQLWSVMGDENFVFNYLPYVYESYQLPIYFRPGVDATHHINAEGIESFYGNSGIYLEDLKTGELVNLSEQQLYSFTASTEDDEARFILHFSGITTVDEDMLSENVQIYSNGNSVYFRFETMPTNDAQVAVFNTLGQQVYGGEVEQSTMSSISLNEKPGIYIVRLQSEKGTTTQKVMIK